MVRKGAYLFSGEERFLKDEALKGLKNQLLDAASAGFNYDEFDGRELDTVNFFNTLKTAPFMSCRRMVVLRNIRGLDKADLARLRSYLENPVRTTTLVFINDAPYLERALTSLLKPYVSERKFRPLSMEALPKWISDRARLLFGKGIEADAARLIADNLASDLARVSRALEKLSVYVGDEKLIRVKDAEALIGRDISNTAFELVESIANRDRAGSLRMLDGLIESGKRAPEIIGSIGWHLMRLKRGRILLDNGASRQELAERLSIRGIFINRFMRQAGSFSRENIDDGLKKLLDCDAALKRSRLKASVALESLIVELCA